MARLRLSALVPPRSSDDSVAVFRWVRTMEIVSGVGLLLAALAFGDPAWLRWVLVALGLLSLSPWPGAAVLVRKAENAPPMVIDKPERERRQNRARRAMAITAAAELALLFVVGLVVGGPSVAIVLVIVGALCVPPGIWLAGRMMRS